jgi:hypothetical protein
VTAVAAEQPTAWAPGQPVQGRADMPVRVPGAIAMRSAQVWHGRIWRKAPSWRLPLWDTCPHNHLKRSAAQACSDKAARRLNKLAARPDHEAWATEGTVKTAVHGWPLAATLWTRWDALPAKMYPLTGLCQPCGQPVTCPGAGQEWQHAEGP